ncbi:MAG: hypothetical protein BWK75_05585 [Candidatus Altiarchaeales archaeon A3]|nr:MAG: hypothetical protein BWK75_05585 [Candidatus Altiarchaeales archaeon A3]
MRRFCLGYRLWQCNACREISKSNWGDINSTVINKIKKRYKKISNVNFINANLLDLKYESLFDTIVSFETIEHLKEEDILEVFKIFRRSLKPNRILIFFNTIYAKDVS